LLCFCCFFVFFCSHLRPNISLFPPRINRDVLRWFFSRKIPFFIDVLCPPSLEEGTFAAESLVCRTRTPKIFPIVECPPLSRRLFFVVAVSGARTESDYPPPLKPYLFSAAPPPPFLFFFPFPPFPAALALVLPRVACRKSFFGTNSRGPELPFNHFAFGSSRRTFSSPTNIRGVHAYNLFP